jgi:hypothetical protein
MTHEEEEKELILKEKVEKLLLLPLTKERLLSILHAIGGSIKSRADYKDQSWNLVQELIKMVEDNN